VWSVASEVKESLDRWPKVLPILKAEGGKYYFVDERLRQIRNVKNPSDFVDFAEGEWQIFLEIAKIEKRVITDEKEIKKTLEALRKVV